MAEYPIFCTHNKLPVLVYLATNSVMIFAPDPVTTVLSNLADSLKYPATYTFPAESVVIALEEETNVSPIHFLPNQ
ncbi:hypothetical protein [Emticicia sp. C21]|uniref:hypothetical protein n=1 Tax=Emticicia sp. C21 TaxID=2302915 RepID=UPI000E351568|nr:hypothetical protein [Emticicia sp. C21]RFS16978.1 hypothetical protein D0T08_09890 [Emticicia sp. C21]